MLYISVDGSSRPCPGSRGPLCRLHGSLPAQSCPLCEPFITCSREGASLIFIWARLVTVLCPLTLCSSGESRRDGVDTTPYFTSYPPVLRSYITPLKLDYTTMSASTRQGGSREPPPPDIVLRYPPGTKWFVPSEALNTGIKNRFSSLNPLVHEADLCYDEPGIHIGFKRGQEGKMHFPPQVTTRSLKTGDSVLMFPLAPVGTTSTIGQTRFEKARLMVGRGTGDSMEGFYHKAVSGLTTTRPEEWNGMTRLRLRTDDGTGN
jgi:hypothetical protein